MAESKDINITVAVRPDEVTISEEGKVEIINVKLREALRVALNAAGELEPGEGAAAKMNFLICINGHDCSEKGPTKATAIK